MNKKDTEENLYIYTDYNLKMSVVGTLQEIADEISQWEWNMSTIENDEYDIRKVSNIKTSLSFWSLFDFKLIPATAYAHN